MDVMKCASPSASAPVDVSLELQSDPQESPTRRSRTQVRHSKGTPELIGGDALQIHHILVAKKCWFIV
jgi:hypothetical protein